MSLSVEIESVPPLHLVMVSYYYSFIFVCFVFPPPVGNHRYELTSILINSEYYDTFYLRVGWFFQPVPVPRIPPRLPLAVKINVATLGPAPVSVLMIGFVDAALSVKAFPIYCLLRDEVLNVL